MRLRHSRGRIAARRRLATAVVATAALAVEATAAVVVEATAAMAVEAMDDTNTCGSDCMC